MFFTSKSQSVHIYADGLL